MSITNRPTQADFDLTMETEQKRAAHWLSQGPLRYTPLSRLLLLACSANLFALLQKYTSP